MTKISGLARLAIVAAIAGLFAFIYFGYYRDKGGFGPYKWGFIALAAMWIVIWLLAETLNPFKLVIGADGRPSTSKLKPFLWTAVVVFSYAALYAARTKKGYMEAIDEIPASLLMAIGFDAATLVAAKGITESQVSSGQIEKPPSADPQAKTDATTVDTQANNGAGAVFQDDKGFPDLTKVQTVTWTVFAIVIYLVGIDSLLKKIASNAVPLFSGQALSNYGLPDIAPALMVLIGLGNAAYLGKKLVTTDTPVLTGLALERIGIKANVTLTGVALGATQGGSRIVVNDKELDVVPLEWTNERVKFTLPDKNPEGGGDWVSGQTVRVRLFVRGQTTNPLTFTITLEPALAEPDPKTGSAGTLVTLKGIALGTTPGDLNINNSKVDPAAVSSWSNEEIRFKLPADHPKGTPLPKGKISISVTVQNKQSNKVDFTVT
jgi:IPT/TIG domain